MRARLEQWRGSVAASVRYTTGVGGVHPPAHYDSIATWCLITTSANSCASSRRPWPCPRPQASTATTRGTRVRPLYATRAPTGTDSTTSLPERSAPRRGTPRDCRFRARPRTPANVPHASMHSGLRSGARAVPVERRTPARTSSVPPSAIRPSYRGQEVGPRNVALSNNAKTTADVRGASARVPARGPSWPRPPGVFDGGRMSRAHIDEAYTRDDVSCARASSGVFARTEQHVGQLLDGAAFRERKSPRSRRPQARCVEPSGLPQGVVLARIGARGEARSSCPLGQRAWRGLRRRAPAPPNTPQAGAQAGRRTRAKADGFEPNCSYRSLPTRTLGPARRG
jgi:hypothetical protein